MLDIQDMFEKDKLFTLLEGLKPMTWLELQCQQVADLNSAMGTAEQLMNFHDEPQKECQAISAPQ